MKREVDKWWFLWILAKIWLDITFEEPNGDALGFVSDLFFYYIPLLIALFKINNIEEKKLFFKIIFWQLRESKTKLKKKKDVCKYNQIEKIWVFIIIILLGLNKFELSWVEIYNTQIYTQKILKT